MFTAEKLAAHGAKLDLGKRLSYGVQNSANNLIDERVKADKLSWEISNGTKEAQFLVISSLFDDKRNNTMFSSVAEMLAACVPGVPSGNVWAFKPGKIVEPTAGESLTVSSKTPGRQIHQFLNYLNTVPTRITAIRLKSVNKADGQADLGNLDNEIKTMFFSPLAQPVEKQLPLSPLVKTNNNFSPNILDVDFIDEAFPLILSNEHFMVIQVNAGTVLNLTVSVGAQDSAAQRHWRTIKDADNILRASK